MSIINNPVAFADFTRAEKQGLVTLPIESFDSHDELKKHIAENRVAMQAQRQSELQDAQQSPEAQSGASPIVETEGGSTPEEITIEGIPCVQYNNIYRGRKTKRVFATEHKKAMVYVDAVLPDGTNIQLGGINLQELEATNQDNKHDNRLALLHMKKAGLLDHVEFTTRVHFQEERDDAAVNNFLETMRQAIAAKRVSEGKSMFDEQSDS